MSQRWKERKFYKVRRQGKILSGSWVGFFSKWSLFVMVLTQKESEDRILGWPCLWACHKLEPPHYSFVTMCTVTGVNDVAPARHPGKVRRKPGSAADTVQCPLITHLVASPWCCGSHPLFSGLLLTENCHCLHPHMPAVLMLLPIRPLKEGSSVCCCRGVVSHHVMLWFSLMLINLAVIWVNLLSAVDKNASTESGVEKAKVQKGCFRHQRRPG